MKIKAHGHEVRFIKVKFESEKRKKEYNLACMHQVSISCMGRPCFPLTMFRCPRLPQHTNASCMDSSICCSYDVTNLSELRNTRSDEMFHYTVVS